MEQNKSGKTVYLLLITILMLFSVSLLPKDLTVLGVELKHVDIISDLKEKEAEPENEFEYNPDFNFDDSESFLLNDLKVNQAGILSSLFNETATPDNNKIAYLSSDVNIKKQPIQGNLTQLNNFFAALKSSKKKSVRILHVGDSIIGGDLITMDVREKLQETFGGNAAGLMRVVANDTKFRMTTKHTYSNNWKTVEYRRNFRKVPLGFNGEAYIPQGNSWVQYETTQHYPHLNGYKTVKVYYCDAKASSIKYSFDGKAAKSASLKPGADVQELVITAPGVAKSVKIEFPEKEQAIVLGVSLENDPGVYIDNISFEGRTGEKLVKIPADKLTEMNKYLNYDLVVFQFGLNVIDKISKDPKGYETAMIETINHYKKALPNAGFLLVGVNDKGFKKGSNIETDPSILTLLSVQQSIVKKTDIAFWNLFEAMGGKDSMVEWVKSNPPLASSDYTHFNDQGAKLVAQMLSEALTTSFSKFNHK